MWTNEPHAEYHAQRGQYFTSHMLTSLLRGDSVRDVFFAERKDSESFAVGRAASVLLLEGRDVFNDTYVVGGPVNPKTGKSYGWGTKTWSEWAEQQTTDAILPEHADLLEAMLVAFQSHPAVQRLLADGIAETTWRADVCGIPCQARPDWVSGYPALVDLKTTSDIYQFELDAKRYRYDHQLAFYRDVMECRGAARMGAYLVAVQKTIPSECLVLQVGERQMLDAHEINRECMASNRAEILEVRSEFLSSRKEKV